MNKDKDTVRKAKDLKSLKELNLSAWTRTAVKKHYGSIDEIIRQGRIISYSFDVKPKNKAPKWQLEFTTALERTGFIRPAEDFSTNFLVGRLYKSILAEEYFITEINQLSNAEYENFSKLSSEEMKNLKKIINGILTEEEFQIICHRFGLNGNTPATMEDTGRDLNITRERVRQLEAKALRKLNHNSEKLPAIFNAPKEISDQLEKLQKEFKELYKNPAVQRADKIIQALRKIDRLPFKTSNDTNIEELEFSVRTYWHLRNANIETIGDIINLPKDDWRRINLRRTGLEEVIEKMHSFGYADFKVELH